MATFLGKSFVQGGNNLPWSHKKTAITCCLSPTPAISTLCELRCSIVHDDDGTSLIPAWSQLMMSSAGIASIMTVVTTSCTNDFKSEKSALERLLFAMVTLRYTKFMHFSRKWAQCVFNRTLPRNSSSQVLLQDNTMPRAAATAIHADIAPPPSLTFLRYTCTLLSNFFPSKTGLPCFFCGRTTGATVMYGA